MPKQLPDMSQDPMTQKDAADYARSVMLKLKASDIYNAIEKAYLMGAKKGFCVGYRVSDIENEKVYGQIIREIKKEKEKHEND